MREYLWSLTWRGKVMHCSYIKLLILSRSHPLQGIRETDNRTKIKSRQRCYLLDSHESEVLFLLFKHYSDIWEKNNPSGRRGAKRKWSSLRKNGNDSVAPQDTARWEGSQGKWSEAVYKTARLSWSTGVPILWSNKQSAMSGTTGAPS